MDNSTTRPELLFTTEPHGEHDVTLPEDAKREDRIMGRRSSGAK